MIERKLNRIISKRSIIDKMELSDVNGFALGWEAWLRVDSRTFKNSLSLYIEKKLEKSNKDNFMKRAFSFHRFYYYITMAFLIILPITSLLLGQRYLPIREIFEKGKENEYIILEGFVDINRYEICYTIFWIVFVSYILFFIFVYFYTINISWYSKKMDSLINENFVSKNKSRKFVRFVIFALPLISIIVMFYFKLVYLSIGLVLIFIILSYIEMTNIYFSEERDIQSKKE